MWTKLVRGFVGGLAGTLPHSAVMLIARRAGWLGTPPPRAITDQMVESLGADPSEGSRRALAIANHVGFGAITGAMFGMAAPRMSLRASIAAGMAYGTAVWLASYQGWVPAIGALPKAHRDRKERQLALFLAHLGYGAVLGAFTALWPHKDKDEDDNDDHDDERE